MIFKGLQWIPQSIYRHPGSIATHSGWLLDYGLGESITSYCHADELGWGQPGKGRQI